MADPESEFGAEGDMADATRSIIAAIRLAFAGVPRGRITIHEAEVIDRFGSSDERQKARRLDTEGSWDRVPDRVIEQCTSALSHLDPDGWRYYLPAYMIVSLKHPRASRSVVSDFTIYALDPFSSDSRLREYKMERFRVLDQAQARAVCRFLRYMAIKDEDSEGRVAQIALDDYWGRFCETTDST